MILSAAVFSPHVSNGVEYLNTEQPSPESADDILLPLDGFSPGVIEATRPGELGPEIGSYLPVFSEMFSESVLTLAPRFYYLYASTDGVIREEAAYGGEISFLTGWWRDTIRVGISGVTSQALYTPAGREGTGLLKSDGNGYWAPGEAYAEINFDDFVVVKAFRQKMDLPFFNIHDIRMTPMVHEAYTAISESISGLTIGGGHITRMKLRNGEDFLSMSEVAGAAGTNRGVSLAGFRYRWRDEKSDIGALNAVGWDTFNTLYAETTHDWVLPNDFELSLSGQFTNQQSIGEELVGDFRTWFAGGQAALSYENWVATLSYTSNGDGNATLNPWGGTPLFNSVMISDFDQAGMDAWRLGLSHHFDDIGLPWMSASANFVEGSTSIVGPGSAPNQREVNVNLDIRPEAEKFDNIWLRFRYGRNDGLKNALDEGFRVILNYSMDF